MSAASLDELRTEREPGPARYRDEDFPGCESFHLPASEIDHYEGRLEFWDGATETAWKIPDTPIQHEGPSRKLTQTAARFEMVRGSPISSFGSSDLVRLHTTGGKRWLMQADEMLYLHPHGVRLQGPAIDVDGDPLPDVVLEVDHTTDVRRRKLGIYQESGFPEIWVLVPWNTSVRAPGLTIHVRHGEEYREEGESRAFPGWRAEEIFWALTEGPVSEAAWRALERTALAMGAREGTGPEDDPLMASYFARLRAKPHAQGHLEGVVQAYREGVVQILEARGIAVDPDFTGDLDLFVGLPGVHLGSGQWPARNPDQNVADLEARIAAGEKGIQEVCRMIADFGLDVVHACMKPGAGYSLASCDRDERRVRAGEPQPARADRRLSRTAEPAGRKYAVSRSSRT